MAIVVVLLILLCPRSNIHEDEKASQLQVGQEVFFELEFNDKGRAVIINLRRYVTCTTLCLCPPSSVWLSLACLLSFVSCVQHNSHVKARVTASQAVVVDPSYSRTYTFNKTADDEDRVIEYKALQKVSGVQNITERICLYADKVRLAAGVVCVCVEIRGGV